MAIKYPKKINNKQISVFDTTLRPTAQKRETYKSAGLDFPEMLSSVSIYHYYETAYDLSKEKIINYFSVACYNENQDKNKIIPSDMYKSSGDSVNKTSYYKITKEEVRQKYG